jgi:NAD(P)-dependent dehydrogenase (short-subunit alcohol dehydrogenase family)
VAAVLEPHQRGPLGRLQVVFLASPGASYVTGTTLDVDGGDNA